MLDDNSFDSYYLKIVDELSKSRKLSNAGEEVRGHSSSVSTLNTSAPEHLEASFSYFKGIIDPLEKNRVWHDQNEAGPMRKLSNAASMPNLSTKLQILTKIPSIELDKVITRPRSKSLTELGAHFPISELENPLKHNQEDASLTGKQETNQITTNKLQTGISSPNTSDSNQGISVNVTRTPSNSIDPLKYKDETPSVVMSKENPQVPQYANITYIMSHILCSPKNGKRNKNIKRWSQFSTTFISTKKLLNLLRTFSFCTS